MLKLTEVLEVCVSMAAIYLAYGVKTFLGKQSQFFKNIYHFDTEDAGSYAKCSPKKHMKPENKVNLEEAVMKWCIKQCLCSMNIRGTEINSVASKIIKFMKIHFKASGGWVW
jgi:hypothetical protein